MRASDWAPAEREQGPFWGTIPMQIGQASKTDDDCAGGQNRVSHRGHD